MDFLECPSSARHPKVGGHRGRVQGTELRRMRGRVTLSGDRRWPLVRYPRRAAEPPCYRSCFPESRKLRGLGSQRSAKGIPWAGLIDQIAVLRHIRFSS